MRHQDLTINHILESWVFANTAARIAAGSYVPGDVGRIGYQSDNKTYWRLFSLAGTTPTWTLIPATFPSAQASAATPSGTTLVSPGTMLGLACVITPTASGKILVTIGGTLQANNAIKVVAAQMRFGTGAAPINGAAGSAGAAIGPSSSYIDATAGSVAPFSLTALVTGAALGTPLWFDLAQWTAAGGSVSLLSVAAVATEIP